MSPQKLIILDRDGVINHDSAHFIKSPDEWQAIEGSLPAIAKLNQAGFIVCVATNQSGVGRGLFDETTLAAIHQKMFDALTLVGGHIDSLVYCPHHPDADCDCRKPKPGMVLELLKRWRVKPENSWIIGDALRDLQAGQAAGTHAILVKTGKGERTLRESSADLENVKDFTNLSHAVGHLLSLDPE